MRIARVRKASKAAGSTRSGADGRVAKGSQKEACDDGGASDSQRPGRVEALLARYQRTRSVKLRDQLIERHLGVVESMARSLVLRLPRCVDVQDLVHAGMWGLMQALDKYCPERSVLFLPFMRIRVRGAMLDELRNMDYLPRLYRQRLRHREEAMARLRQELARDPSEAELAEELGISVGAMRRHYVGTAPQFHVNSGTDLNGEGRGDHGTDKMDRLADDGVESPIEALNRRELLEKIRESLQPVEWKVLQLHYLEGMSGKEVARKLHLSASRICQIHGRVMDRLKIRLASVAV